MVYMQQRERIKGKDEGNGPLIPSPDLFPQLQLNLSPFPLPRSRPSHAKDGNSRRK